MRGVGRGAEHEWRGVPLKLRNFLLGQPTDPFEMCVAVWGKQNSRCRGESLTSRICIAAFCFQLRGFGAWFSDDGGLGSGVWD